MNNLESYGGKFREQLSPFPLKEFHFAQSSYVITLGKYFLELQ